MKRIRILNKSAVLTLAAAAVLWSGLALAKDVNIASFLPSVTFAHLGKTYTIERIEDQENSLTGGFAKTSRKCPPFCIHSMKVADGVATVGELEVLEFLKNKVEKRTGMLVDARTTSWYNKGTIPGSVNIPFSTFDLPADDPRLVGALRRLDARPGGSVNWSDAEQVSVDDIGTQERQFQWDFSQAKEILVFCNGPWCDQSPRAIKGLIKMGYPRKKIYYYRGGMQMWLMLGLTVITP